VPTGFITTTQKEKTPTGVSDHARDKYLTEKTSKVTPSESVSFTTYQPVLLRDGAIWLYKISERPFTHETVMEWRVHA
jgi:hypothetical protein